MLNPAMTVGTFDDVQIDLASGITVSNLQAVCRGDLVTISGNFIGTFASGNTATTIGSIHDSKYRPKSQINAPACSNANVGYAIIDTSGSMAIKTSAGGSAFAINATYAIK